MAVSLRTGIARRSGSGGHVGQAGGVPGKQEENRAVGVNQGEGADAENDRRGAFFFPIPRAPEHLDPAEAQSRRRSGNAQAQARGNGRLRCGGAGKRRHRRGLRRLRAVRPGEIGGAWRAESRPVRSVPRGVSDRPRSSGVAARDRTRRSVVAGDLPARGRRRTDVARATDTSFSAATPTSSRRRPPTPRRARTPTIAVSWPSSAGHSIAWTKSLAT